VRSCTSSGHDRADDLIARRDPSLNFATQDRLRTVSDGYYFAIAACATLGACLWWRARREVVVAFIVLVGSLSALIGILYAGIDRYHESFVPFMALMAAPLIVMAFNVARNNAVDLPGLSERGTPG
jgi:CHASE2 domain-containing sensor protein